MVDIFVSVVIVTYNQEKWIAQAIESILSQKTDYAYEVIIGEDMGTDNTRSICRSYAKKYSNIFLIPREKNLGLIGNFVDCIKHTKGKYVMILAGDDYWNISNKIQLQVEFMETHAGCVACHTDYDELRVFSNKLIKNVYATNHFSIKETYSPLDILAGSFYVSTCTMCCDGDVLRDKVPLDMFVEEKFPYEDLPLILFLSSFGKILYMPISSYVYRVGQTSLTNQNNYEKIVAYWQSTKKMLSKLFEYFPELKYMQDDSFYDNFVYNALLNAAFENNDYKSAKIFAKKNPSKRIASMCAQTWITFQLFRLYRLLIKH